MRKLIGSVAAAILAMTVLGVGTARADINYVAVQGRVCAVTTVCNSPSGPCFIAVKLATLTGGAVLAPITVKCDPNSSQVMALCCSPGPRFGECLSFGGTLLPFGGGGEMIIVGSQVQTPPDGECFTPDPPAPC